MTNFNINEINYTKTDAGYCYKGENGKQTRIKGAEFEEAYEAYKAEIAKAEAEKPAEEKKAKAKKPAKKRRPKDIAYEGNGITLTARQKKFIERIPEDEFYEDGVNSTLWTDYYCETIADEFNGMAAGAIISTLREKGIIGIGIDKVNGKTKKCFYFTELGKKVAAELGLA